jgi:hypothetical protein
MTIHAASTPTVRTLLCPARKIDEYLDGDAIKKLFNESFKAAAVKVLGEEREKMTFCVCHKIAL